VVVEPGAQLCTPLEVNRRKFGCRRLARKRSVRRGSGAPDADGPGECLSQPLGVGVDSLVFILIPRIDHKIRMVINRLNHRDLYMRIGTMKDSKTKAEESTRLTYTGLCHSYCHTYLESKLETSVSER
jgi:hypothetical protein